MYNFVNIAKYKLLLYLCLFAVLLEMSECLFSHSADYFIKLVNFYQLCTVWDLQADLICIFLISEIIEHLLICVGHFPFLWTVHDFPPFFIRLLVFFFFPSRFSRVLYVLRRFALCLKKERSQLGFWKNCRSMGEFYHLNNIKYSDQWTWDAFLVI